ncbi:Secondary metabolism regulator laeA [Colletotrichum sidae]|uniref:Secondary metabolism regulator laeA n=1 Tax=Colletotrichum sidae TaxID=1347389 RepID=A0A4R8TAX4_9PEZI|nr:Secondary metabolism regulator laeA [Colletotrichum sidae]
MSAPPDQTAATTASPVANGTRAPAAGPSDAPIAIDPAIGGATDDDDQSDARSVNTSSTASLSESITQYRMLHGRTYTQKIEYWGPNDEQQQEGLELNHYMLTRFLGDRLFLAPLKDSPQMVLDVGTGTGSWAIDFADEFPSSEVIGVDISPIQPSWNPPNCKFQIDDVEQPWTWPSNEFDYIHIRNLEGAVADWVTLYKEAFTCLKEDGYIEVKEFDIETRSQVKEFDELHIFKRWVKHISAGCEQMGKTPIQCRGNGIGNNLREAGFVDIVEQKWPIPIGGWAKDPMLKDVGQSALEYLDRSLDGFGLYILKEISGWEYAEVVLFVAEARKALKDVTLQPLLYLHTAHARKPQTSS